MRFLLTILAIYVLGLSVHPCEDSKPISVSTINTVVSDHAVVYEHVVLEQDICPPFCLCSCCSIVLDLPAVHLFPISLIEYEIPYMENIQLNPNAPTFDIFQPPRGNLS